MKYRNIWCNTGIYLTCLVMANIIPNITIAQQVRISWISTSTNRWKVYEIWHTTTLTNMDPPYLTLKNKFLSGTNLGVFIFYGQTTNTHIIVDATNKYEFFIIRERDDSTLMTGKWATP